MAVALLPLTDAMVQSMEPWGLRPDAPIQASALAAYMFSVTDAQGVPRALPSLVEVEALWQRVEFRKSTPVTWFEAGVQVSASLL